MSQQQVVDLLQLAAIGLLLLWEVLHTISHKKGG